MSTATPADSTMPAQAVDALVPAVARVLRRRRESRDVWTLELALESEPVGAVTAFAPGQFNMLTAFGVGEAAVSLAGDPARSGRIVHTIRAVGAVSRALVALPRGAPVGVRGPYGVGWPLADGTGRDVLIVAGGLGLAPLRSVLFRLAAARERYGRVTLLYGARSPAEILYRRELVTRWQRASIDVEVIVDHARAGWSGHVGVVTALLPRVIHDPARTYALVCGPEIMMRFAVAGMRDAGVAETSIHLSLERNMKCAVAWCGRCQFGRVLVCRDGPVFRYDRVRDALANKEL